MNTSIVQTVHTIGQILAERQLTVTTIESCTGGGIAQMLTSEAGSSRWFEQGLITYSNEAKAELANVSMTIIESYGAVSEEVAAAMADGGRVKANADFALSVTGIAGPGGGSKAKPVGTVCFGWSISNTQTITDTQLFSGDRLAVRTKTVEHSLNRLLELLT